MSTDGHSLFRTFRYRSFDGLLLAARDYGAPGPGLPVVCLPGLSRSVRDFHALACELSDGRRPARRVIAFDYRGRGASDHDPDWRNYTVQVEAGDILDGMTALGVHRAAFVGTSRGGLATMAIATARPGAVAAAVLNDIGPVVEAAGLARIKVSLEAMHDPVNWAVAADQLQRFYRGQFTALDSDGWRAFAEATYRSDGGLPRVDFDPALLKTLAGVSADQPLPPIWPQFAALRNVPVLVLRGANSDILSPETVATMARLHRDLETIVVDGHGHPPLLMDAELIRTIGDFVDRCDGEADRAPSAAGGAGFLRH